MQRSVVAVIVDATPEEVTASLPEAANLRAISLGAKVTALLLPESNDMLAYGMLAWRCGEVLGVAVMVLCLPERSHQVSQVFRKGARAHAYHRPAGSERGAAEIPLPQHFAGCGESWVEAPLVDGLASASLSADVAAIACRVLGDHEHSL